MAGQTVTSPIQQPQGLTSLLTDLLGRNVNTTGSQTGVQTNGSTTTGTSGGSTSGSITNTADLGPLLQAFAQSSQGMSPEQLQALIGSIFTEGSRQVPSIIGAYANATGSRATGNSASQLALDELNRGMTTQAVQALLNYNANSQQTAANAAGQIANNTRQTQQQQTQQTNTGQTQTGTQANTQATQQRQVQTVNPSMAGLVGLGGTALNFLDKKFNLTGAGRPTPSSPTGTPGTISGNGSPVADAAPSFTGGSTLANPSGVYATTTPAQSSGFITSPSLGTPAPGMGYSTSGLGNYGTSAIDSSGAGGLGGFSFGNGLSGIGSTTGYGGLGSGAVDLGSIWGSGAGSLPNYFDIGGTGTLGNVGSGFFGSNPYGYSGSLGGITDAAGMNPLDSGFNWSSLGDDALSGLSNFGGSIGSALGGFGSGLADIGSSLWDAASSFFADGGMIRRAAYADGGGIGAPGDTRYGNTGPATAAPMNMPAPTGNIWQQFDRKRQMAAGLMPIAPQILQRGNTPIIPAGTPNPMPVTPQAVMSLVPFLAGQMMGFADGGPIGPQLVSAGFRNPSLSINQPFSQPPSMPMVDRMDRYVMPGYSSVTDTDRDGYADGGQVQTGGTNRVVRNRNNMGAPLRRDQQEALNYEGYISPDGLTTTSGVGGNSASSGGAVAPSAGATVAPMALMSSAAPSAQQVGQVAMNYTPEQIAMIRAQALAEMAARQNPNANTTVDRAGGSGGQGEGAAPSGAATDGIGTGTVGAGIAGQIGSTAASIGGFGVPGLASAIAAMMAAISNTISNSAAPANIAALDALMASLAAQAGVDSNIGNPSPANTSADALGLDPSSVPEGMGFAGNVGGDSTGDSGSGVGSGGATGGSTSGEGGNGGGNYADGGMVYGAGTGTSDSIRVRSREPGGPDISYSDGELVMPKDVVDFYGASTLQRMIDAVHTPVSR